jgi:hypothetical protein
MFMRVVRAEKYRDSHHHQGSGSGVLHVPSLAQDRYGGQRADEGGCGKESSLTGRAEQAEREHVEHQAHPVTDES